MNDTMNQVADVVLGPGALTTEDITTKDVSMGAMLATAMRPTQAPAPATPEDLEVDKGLRTWNAMRAENTRINAELSALRNYSNKLEAVNDELNSTMSAVRSELELYKMMAIRAKVHLHILQGHVFSACEEVKAIATGEKDK